MKTSFTQFQAMVEFMESEKSRFEVVDELVKKWLLKYGGDPSKYKKQTKAFDALAALADQLLRQHVEAMEGVTKETHEVMEAVEGALKQIVDDQKPLSARLGPALATLLHTAEVADMETEETMTSLVNSLVDEEYPVTEEVVDEIDPLNVMEDIRDCGIKDVPDEDLERIILLSISCLRAQIISPEELNEIDKEVQRALSADTMKLHMAATGTTTSHTTSETGTGPASPRAEDTDEPRDT